MDSKEVIDKYRKEYEDHRIGSEIMSYINKKYTYSEFYYGGNYKVKMPFGEKIWVNIKQNKALRETNDYFGTIDLDKLEISMFTQNSF
jgi:hypothetical protein